MAYSAVSLNHPATPMPPISSDQKLQLLLEHSECAMIVLDADAIIQEWSSGAERLLGWSAQEAIGLPAALIQAPHDRAPDSAQADLERVRALGRTTLSRAFLRRDGTTVSCEGTLDALRAGAGPDDELLGFGLVLRACRATDVSQEHLRLATEAAQLGIWTWDVARDTVTWQNPRMAAIFGVGAGQDSVNAARLTQDYLHPDDVGLFQLAVERTLLLGERFHFVGRFWPQGTRANDVQPCWLEMTGIRQTDPGDTPVIIGTAADITERKRDEEDLRQARMRLEATLSAAEVASWIWDIQHDRVIADRNLSKLFGVAEDLAPGAPLARYVGNLHPEDMPAVSRLIQRAIDTGEPYHATYRVLAAGSGWRWLDARGRVEYDDLGRPATLTGVAIDITRQRALQDSYRLTEERYRTLITSMDQAFGIVQVLLDEQGKPRDYRFEEVNRALEQQSGLVNAAGRTIREMVPAIESRWIEIYGRVALTRKPERFIEHSAAMGYWWDVYATPIGEPHELRIAILFTDVTARRQAEENLRQLAADLSEANRRKTEFLATLAHELRNPLAPLRTGLDLIRLGASGAQPNGKVLDMMDRQLRQMVHLIDDLMDLSRINSGKIVLKTACIDLRTTVENAVETALPALEAARHELQLDLPRDPVMIDADATRLAQILGNLLANAIKYTPNGGHIRVAAGLDAASVALSVRDSGIGIPHEEQEGVFDMFSQVSRNMGRAQGGLGIGLSLVRSLAAMHGGAIAVTSPGAGQGSTFTLTLPLAPACQPDHDGARRVADERGVPGQRALRVLVADDNVDAASMLASLLRAAGHATETVHDGVRAAAHIEASRPDVAILDIGMPGLNGYEVAQKIRRLPGMEQVVLVALTGWGGDSDRRRSQLAGFDAHLTKPAGFAELKRLLADVSATPRP